MEKHRASCITRDLRFLKCGVIESFQHISRVAAMLMCVQQLHLHARCNELLLLKRAGHTMGNAASS